MSLCPCCCNKRPRNQSSCAICCDESKPLYNLPCQQCSKCENGFSDKLVCLECSKRLQDSINKCPFCSTVLSDTVTIEKKDLGAYPMKAQVVLAANVVVKQKKRCVQKIVMSMKYRDFYMQCYVPCCYVRYTLQSIFLALLYGAITFVCAACLCSGGSDTVCWECWLLSSLMAILASLLMLKMFFNELFTDAANVALAIYGALVLTGMFCLRPMCLWDFQYGVFLFVFCPLCTCCFTRTNIEMVDN